MWRIYELLRAVELIDNSQQWQSIVHPTVWLSVRMSTNCTLWLAICKRIFFLSYFIYFKVLYIGIIDNIHSGSIWFEHDITAKMALYIYIYQMDCVCQRYHKECSTRTCADDCYNCWKKSTMVSWIIPIVRQSKTDCVHRQVMRPLRHGGCLKQVEIMASYSWYGILSMNQAHKSW